MTASASQSSHSSPPIVDRLRIDGPTAVRSMCPDGVAVAAMRKNATANGSSQPTQQQQNNQWLVLVVLVIVAVIGVSLVVQ